MREPLLKKGFFVSAPRQALQFETRPLPKNEVKPLIRLTGVSKTFPGKQQVHALNDIDLEIPAGQIYGIIGQSGAGKSTLIRCINMLEKPTKGDIWVDDLHINQLTERQLRAARKSIGMIFQHFNLLSSRTVYGNVAFPMEIARVDKEIIRKRVPEMLEVVGLTDKAQVYPAKLSGGQKQRVGIARALANRPKVLLCDEATSALDPETTKSVLHLLKAINESMGLTIVLITHEMHVIQEICDRVTVIEDGYVQESGPVIEVFTKPKSEATRRMIRGSIETQIPDELLERAHGIVANGSRLLKLSFVGPSAHQPIISEMLRQYSVEANILFGKIDQMKDIPFGMLLIELRGEQTEAAQDYLEAQDIDVEVF